MESQTHVSQRTGRANEVSKVIKSKAESKAAYDRMSKWYDLLTGSSEKKFRKAGLENRAFQRGASRHW